MDMPHSRSLHPIRSALTSYAVRRDAPGGIYHYRPAAEHFSQTKQMVLIK
jgi:hypothetical protein